MNTGFYLERRYWLVAGQSPAKTEMIMTLRGADRLTESTAEGQIF
jgi:hypothetical protein